MKVATVQYDYMFFKETAVIVLPFPKVNKVVCVIRRRHVRLRCCILDVVSIASGRITKFSYSSKVFCTEIAVEKHFDPLKCDFWGPQKIKTFSASGGLRPLTPLPGALSLDPAGGSAPRPPL